MGIGREEGGRGKETGKPGKSQVADKKLCVRSGSYIMFFKAARIVCTERQGGSHILCKAGVQASLQFSERGLRACITGEKLEARPSVLGSAGPPLFLGSVQAVNHSSGLFVLLLKKQNSRTRIQVSVTSKALFFYTSHLFVSVHS